MDHKLMVQLLLIDSSRNKIIIKILNKMDRMGSNKEDQMAKCKEDQEDKEIKCKVDQEDKEIKCKVDLEETNRVDL